NDVPPINTTPNITSTLTSFTTTTAAGVRGNGDGIDLDLDAGGSRLEDNSIVQSGDDGIDLLGSSALVRGNRILRAADRGISIEGEGSPRLEYNVVAHCADGLALKDGSTSIGHHNTVTGCRNGLSVFIKENQASGATAALHSCIIWGNDRDVFVDSESDLSLSHSNFENEDPRAWGSENFSADPEFFDLDVFSLSSSSPCVGRGRDGTDVGAASVTARAVVVDSVTPENLSTLGGVVTVRGSGFERVAEVTTSGEEAIRLLLQSPGEIRIAVSPAVRPGPFELQLNAPKSEPIVRPLRFGRDLFRGDVNGDFRVDLSDAMSIASHLFLNTPGPLCTAAGDVDESEVLDLNDAIALVRYLFGGSPIENGVVDCE
ncbi:MAG: right-handed parallel beta-helix repeat-containing protein, partial [Planctomycetota bacterium]